MANTFNAQAAAAVMMVQSLILTLLERRLLSGEDVSEALDDVLEAQRSATADHPVGDEVLRVLAKVAEVEAGRGVPARKRVVR